MIGSPRNNRENYPTENTFDHKKRKPGLSANWPLKNWAQLNVCPSKTDKFCTIIIVALIKQFTKLKYTVIIGQNFNMLFTEL